MVAAMYSYTTLKQLADLHPTMFCKPFACLFLFYKHYF